MHTFCANCQKIVSYAKSCGFINSYEKVTLYYQSNSNEDIEVRDIILSLFFLNCHCLQILQAQTNCKFCPVLNFVYQRNSWYELDDNSKLICNYNNVIIHDCQWNKFNISWNNNKFHFFCLSTIMLVIYFIVCNCFQFYIGETDKPLSQEWQDILDILQVCMSMENFLKSHFFLIFLRQMRKILWEKQRIYQPFVCMSVEWMTAVLQDIMQWNFILVCINFLTNMYD